MNGQEREDAQTPLSGYFIAAGIPGGLLLWWGCNYVLKYTGATPEEMGYVLPLLKLAAGLGLVMAVLATGVLIWGIFKKTKETL